MASEARHRRAMLRHLTDQRACLRRMVRTYQCAESLYDKEGIIDWLMKLYHLS